MRVLPLAGLLLLGSTPFQEAPDRSPISLALSADGRWALTANATSDTASLVDLSEGKVVAEVAVGKRPFAVAWAQDRAVVTNWMADTVTVLEVAPPKLAVVATLPVGDEPRGVAINGTRVYVALAGDDSVAVIDLHKLKVTSRVAVGDEPWHLALTPDGKRLAVGHALSLDVRVLDAADLKTLHTVRMRGPNLRQLAISPDGAWAYVPNVAERGSPTTNNNIARGWVIANRLSRVPLTEDAPRETIALDPSGEGVGDADGIAVSPDGERLAVAAGGSHELLLFRLPLPFVAFGGPGDHMERALVKDAKRFRRVPLEGRPVSVRFAPDGASVVVANYLRNSLQVVDVAKAEIKRTIDLGGPSEKSLARKGEWIFYDASRSFTQWFSCHSCHTDGHTNGATYDTFNDGKYGNAKKTLSLRGVTKTAPYTWHGWEGDLRAALTHSMRKTMAGSTLTDAELDGLVAFLATVDFPPPREPSSPESVRRGQDVFKAKGCVACHAPPDYTSSKVHEVGLESDQDAYRGFNPPSLRGVGTRAPYLHDGRAKTLDDVLRKHHSISKFTDKTDPTDAELADLIAFLKSL